MERRRIVVIEDDRDIAKLVHAALREDGHVVGSSTTASMGSRRPWTPTPNSW